MRRRSSPECKRRASGVGTPEFKTETEYLHPSPYPSVKHQHDVGREEKQVNKALEDIGLSLAERNQTACKSDSEQGHR